MIAASDVMKNALGMVSRQLKDHSIFTSAIEVSAEGAFFTAYPKRSTEGDRNVTLNL